MPKTILHLCADIGSDSYPYQQDPNYEVILVGRSIGVENFSPPPNVHGVFANPVCTEFSTVRSGGRARLGADGFDILWECFRIIIEANPAWFVVENPATGRMRDVLGPPRFVYQPFEFGSPWTKKTALWGKFNPPQKQYQTWDDCPEKIQGLYARPGRKPSLAFMHKNDIVLIDEFAPFRDSVASDMCIRSLCSQKFAEAFKRSNP